MTRLALLLALPLVAACGDDAVATGSATSTGDAPTTTTTGDSTTTTTGELPTTSSAASSSGSDSATSDSTTTTGTTTTTDASSSSGTTQAIDLTTSSTGDTSTTTDTSTSTSSDESSSSSSSSTTDDSTTAEVDIPMPAGICNEGQGSLTSFADPMPQPEELHIVGVYQATGNAITVTINRTNIPLTVILSSYEPVKFTLVLAPGVQLEHVILNGYNPHTVQGQGAAMVTNLSDNFDYLAACAYVWPESDGGCDTPTLVMGAEALTGLDLTTFVGCYEGVSFTLD